MSSRLKEAPPIVLALDADPALARGRGIRVPVTYPAVPMEAPRLCRYVLAAPGGGSG